MNTKAVVQWIENKSFNELFETGFLSSYATRHLSKYQKAAVFLITIGLETAGQILKHLPEEEIEKITSAIVEMKQVSKDMTMAVLDELEHSVQTPNYTGGADYAQALLSQALGTRQSRAVMERVRVAEQIGYIPFARLQPIDTPLLQTLLGQESAQTVALVLSYLPAQKAGEILSSLTQETQGEIVKRMADTQYVVQETLQILEETLWQKFLAVKEKPPLKVLGLNVISSVLNQTRTEVRERILTHIEKGDQSLAQRIRDAMFTFEDLILLTDNAIQLLIRSLDQQLLSYALKGTSEAVRNKFFSNMSQRASGLMKENIAQLPPTPKAEIHTKQLAILETIRKLEKDGKIIISRSADEWIQ